MIRDLLVRNLVIVDRAALSLHEGLIAITGETGAGKSVLLGSLELACGGRATTDLIRPREEEASVSAVFQLHDREIEVHRTLTIQGRHKVRVNGENGSLADLRSLLENAVAIHTQGEAQALADPSTHKNLLDQAMPDQTLLVTIADKYNQLQAARRALQSHLDKAASRKDRLDWIAFQIRTLEPFAMQEEEYGESLLRASRLRHAELIRETVDSSLQTLMEDEQSATDRIGRAATRLQELARQVDSYQALAQQADDLGELLSELVRALQSLHREGDEERADDSLDELETRIEGVQRYAREQGVAPEAQWAHLSTLRAEQASLSDYPAATQKLEEAATTALEAYQQSAQTLSEAREEAARQLTEEITPLLGKLALPDAILRFSFQPGEPSALGSDIVELLFASSRDLPPRPLHKVASGGELSRVLLALKVLESRRREPHTIIFDEIDAGVGGRTAHAIADVLVELARRHQVVAITHLPQVAAKADQHFSVQKVTINERTVARIKPVDGEARLRELSRMLGGDIGPEGLRLAEKLMKKGEQQ